MLRVEVVNGKRPAILNRHLAASVGVVTRGGSIFEHHVGLQEAHADILVVTLQFSVRELVGVVDAVLPQMALCKMCKHTSKRSGGDEDVYG